MLKPKLPIPVLLWCFCIGCSVDVGAQAVPTSTPVREKYDTADFDNVEKRIAKLLTRYPPDQILLVMDIDNTLLAMNQDLGSDQWFNWQSDLLKHSPQSQDLVASEFEGLLHVQGTLFALSGMHPPEPGLPDMVSRIQNRMGVTTVVLTSRGPEFRNAAERELINNGYRFAESDNTLQIVEKRGLFKPFDPAEPDAHGLSSAIIAQHLNRLREVTYSNGIYMTAGQHKGYMLKTLLARAVLGIENPRVRRQFKAIVLVDDHRGHTDDVHEAFDGDDVDLVTFHYMQEDGNVQNFNDSSKRHVVRDWNRLQEFIEFVLVK